MKFKKIMLCLLMICISVTSGCQKQEEKKIEIPQVTGKFDFTILKSGQADAIMMHTQNHNVIIDCGEEDDGDEILEYLKERNITNIDYIIITHYDKDHVGGFPQVIKNISAENIVVSNYEGNNDEYAEYVKTVEQNQLDVTPLDEDITFTLDDVLFEVSIPHRKSYVEGDNDFSLVVSVTHGENTFLFAGDAEKERLTEVLAQFKNEYDFLKVPHHGKYNKYTKRFATAVKPRFSVICDSTKNPAEEETVDILEFVGSKVYCTKDGSVFVLSDGKDITVKQ